METDKDDVRKILDDAKQLADNCGNFLKELEEMRKGRDFLLEQYRTNKRWFRQEPGRVTVEDVIKMAFEFGWTSKEQYDHEHNNR